MTHIAFQGAAGAYSHLACLEGAPHLTPLPCADFESAIMAVTSGKATHAMLPIDNTLAGRVADIHRLLPESNLHIIGEYFLPIRHCLLGVKGATLQDVTIASSHIHALPQCRDFIAAHKLQRHVSSDTAGAAQEVAERNDKSWAAIASSIAAEIYGLDILATDIADATNNRTRFVLMTTKAQTPPVDTPHVVTSMIFETRSVPAALYKALGGFATNGLNLSKLESYLTDGRFDAATFYCEIEGHPESAAMKLAMEELQFFAHSIRILGTYPAHPFRLESRQTASL